MRRAANPADRFVPRKISRYAARRPLSRHTDQYGFVALPACDLRLGSDAGVSHPVRVARVAGGEVRATVEHKTMASEWIIWSARSDAARQKGLFLARDCTPCRGDSRSAQLRSVGRRWPPHVIIAKAIAARFYPGRAEQRILSSSQQSSSATAAPRIALAVDPTLNIVLRLVQTALPPQTHTPACGALRRWSYCIPRPV